MRKRFLFLTIFLFTMFFLFSCGPKPSFTNENIEEGLKNILKKEFDIDSIVKKNNETLGICFKVPKLFSSAKKTSPIVMDQLQNVMLCMRRVLLSTNADVKFFQLNIRGDDTSLEISMLRYIRDLKILLLSGISFGDYSKRMLYKNVSNIASLGRKRLEMFFKDYGRKKPEDIITSHFVSKVKRNNISKEFITWIWESLMKLNSENSIIETRIKSLNEKRYFFYCKVMHTYDKKQAFQNFSFSTHSGNAIEFIFEIEAFSFYNVKINRVIILNSNRESDNNFVKNLTKLYGPVSSWAENDFHVFEVTLAEFIAEQIAGRIQGSLSERNSKKEVETVFDMTVVKGFFEDEVFKIFFIYKDPKMKIKSEDLKLALKTANEVCELYKFKECKDIKIGTLGEELSTHSLFN